MRQTAQPIIIPAVSNALLCSDEIPFGDEIPSRDKTHCAPLECRRVRNSFLEKKTKEERIIFDFRFSIDDWGRGYSFRGTTEERLDPGKVLWRGN
jgi:hypothetical protein